MKAIHYYIYTILSLALLACSGSDEELSAISREDGRLPISLRATAPQQTRADYAVLRGTEYDIYTCSVYHGEDERLTGYYSPTEIYDPVTDKVKYYSVFGKMDYSEEDNLFYFRRYFYPMSGTIDMLSIGTPKGKKFEGTAYPEMLSTPETAEYVEIDLNTYQEGGVYDYDGSFEMIAAIPLRVTCTTSLKIGDLPFAHYQHVQAHLNFKFKWADGMAAGAGIINNLKINSVSLENTPCRGTCRIKNTPGVLNIEWPELSEDDAVVPNFTPATIDHADGLVAGNGVYVIPQEKRQRIIVNYTITNNGVEKTMNYVLEENDAEAAKGWLAGHKYTYVIKIGDGGYFSINQIEIQNNSFAPGHVGTTVIEGDK